MQRIDIAPGLYVLLAPIGAPGGLSAAREAVASLLRAAAGTGASIVHAPDGSPLAAGCDLRISVSHSRHIAALAVNEGPERIGVDIEEPRPAQLARVAARVMSQAELDDIDSLPGGLLQAWTLKEAVFKAAGEADVADLREIAIDTATAATATLRGRRLRILLSRHVAQGDTGAWLSLAAASEI